MANAFIEVPKEATKVAAWAAASGGRFALDVGEGLIHRAQPGYIPPEIVAQQAVLKRFEGRLGVVDLMDLESTDEGSLVDHAYAAADALVDGGVVGQHTAVELRPVLPEAALWSPELNERREKAMELLQLALEEEHNVMAIPNSHPITPSEHPDSPLDIGTTWAAFAPELDGLWRQLSVHREYEPAMLGITGLSYEQAMFGGHIAVVGEPDQSDFLLLEHVGKRPEENRVVLH